MSQFKLKITELEEHKWKMLNVFVSGNFAVV